MKKSSFFLLFCLSISFNHVIAQKQFNLDMERTSLTISGKSTLHDWIVIGKECEGKANVTLDENLVIAIQSMFFHVKVKSLDSGKPNMDHNICVAMLEESHPEVLFQMSKIKYITKSKDNAGADIKAEGNLTIAGSTNKIELDVYAKVLSDGSIQFQGSYPLKMTAYKIDPPTALAGTIETEDQVVIKFSAVYR